MEKRHPEIQRGIMRIFLSAAAMVGAALGSAASAADLPNTAPEGKRWMSCYIYLTNANSGVQDAIAIGGYWLVTLPDYDRTESQNRLRDQWVQEYVPRVPSEFPGKGLWRSGSGYDARCNSHKSRSEWASFEDRATRRTSLRVLRSDYVPSFAHGWVSSREHERGYSGKVATSGGTATPRQAEEVELRAPDSTADANRSSDRMSQQERDLEQARAAERAAREAEWQAKVAAHEASVANYRRRVAEREAEIARQQSQHSAAQDAAARELAAHQRELDAANRRQQEYFAAQRRHALCVGGDQKACADIEAGRPALGEQLAEAGQASTDTDANRCVTTAEVRVNDTFQGNTAASVLNGCGQSVDVRICLRRASDWNCGTDWGVGPQERASHSSFNATGQVFVDARVTGSNRPLASP